jgi:hypothetical protein
MDEIKREEPFQFVHFIHQDVHIHGNEKLETFSTHEEIRNLVHFCPNPEYKDNFEDPGVDGKIILI